MTVQLEGHDRVIRTDAIAESACRLIPHRADRELQHLGRQHRVRELPRCGMRPDQRRCHVNLIGEQASHTRRPSPRSGARHRRLVCTPARRPLSSDLSAKSRSQMSSNSAAALMNAPTMIAFLSTYIVLSIGAGGGGVEEAALRLIAHRAPHPADDGGSLFEPFRTSRSRSAAST